MKVIPILVAVGFTWLFVIGLVEVCKLGKIKPLNVPQHYRVITNEKVYRFQRDNDVSLNEYKTLQEAVDAAWADYKALHYQYLSNWIQVLPTPVEEQAKGLTK